MWKTDYNCTLNRSTNRNFQIPHLFLVTELTGSTRNLSEYVTQVLGAGLIWGCHELYLICIYMYSPMILTSTWSYRVSTFGRMDALYMFIRRVIIPISVTSCVKFHCLIHLGLNSKMSILLNGIYTPLVPFPLWTDVQSFTLSYGPGLILYTK